MHSRIIVIITLSLLTVLMGQEDEFTLHFKNPWAGDSVFKDGKLYIVGSGKISTASGPLSWHPGMPMEKDAIGDWYKITFTKMPDLTNFERGLFAFRIGFPPNFNIKMEFDSTGITTKSSMYDLFDANEVFQVKSLHPFKEIWIYLNISNEVVITSIPPDCKLLMLYNPWPASAPLISVGMNPYKIMRIATREIGSPYCNWYQYWFTSGELFQVHFKEAMGKKLQWGLAGLGDEKPINLTALFTNADTVFLFPDRKPSIPEPLPAPPKMQTSFPEGFEGICSYDFGFTIRDFSPNTHPDFHNSLTGQFMIKKLVENTLGPDNKPVLSALGKTKIKQFDWFSEDTPEKYEKCIDIPMKKANNGFWTFDSYYDTHNGISPNPSFQFFPIDDWNPHGDPLVPEGSFPKKVGNIWPSIASQWGPGRKDIKHNNHFCMEGHAKFKYLKGQTFTFNGDDDVWVYIDKTLMIDLGWMHIPKLGMISLDQVARIQNWDVNSEHTFDIFYCDRDSPGSNLMMQSSIFFEQAAGFFTELSVDSATGIETYAIKQSAGGKGRCPAAAPAGLIQPASADIVLKHPGGKIDSLHKANPFQASGLSISSGTDRIILNKKELTKNYGILSGTYKIILINRSRPDETASIYFTISKTIDAKNRLAPVHNVKFRGILTAAQEYLAIPGSIIRNSGVKVTLYDLKGKKLAQRSFKKSDQTLLWRWKDGIETVGADGIYFFKATLP